jgi:hypothetical protein
MHLRPQPAARFASRDCPKLGAPLSDNVQREVAGEIGQADFEAAAWHADEFESRTQASISEALNCARPTDRTRAQVALPQAICAGIFLPVSFLRWGIAAWAAALV